MFKAKDITTLGIIHNELQKASVNLKYIENCNTNDHCKKLRSEAREFIHHGRRKIRDLKQYILDNEWRR